MRPILPAAMLAAALLAAAPASAQTADEQPSARELLGEAGEKLLRALELMLKAIPQYHAPEINDNGDIIIRRRRPDQEPKPAPAPETAPGAET